MSIRGMEVNSNKVITVDMLNTAAPCWSRLTGQLWRLPVHPEHPRDLTCPVTVDECGLIHL